MKKIKIKIKQKPPLYSMGNSAQCYVLPWMGEGLGRMNISICMAESLHCSPETITALLIVYTPIQNVFDV